MAVEKKDDKVRQDLPKLTEQHEGLPGYLDSTLPTTGGDETGEKKGN